MPKDSDIPCAITCERCGRVVEVILPFEGWVKWQTGDFVQDAFPDLPADQREMLISATCSECWDKMFGR